MRSFICCLRKKYLDEQAVLKFKEARRAERREARQKKAATKAAQDAAAAASTAPVAAAPAATAVLAGVRNPDRQLYLSKSLL
jgi:hypothetical protein